MQTQKSYRSAFIFVTSLFFLWGFITVLVDSLIPRLREVFTLTYFQAGLVQFAFFMAYFVLSIPAGYILSKIGYKKGIVLGLSTMAVGCLLLSSCLIPCIWHFHACLLYFGWRYDNTSSGCQSICRSTWA